MANNKTNRHEAIASNEENNPQAEHLAENRKQEEEKNLVEQFEEICDNFSDYLKICL